VFLAPFPAHHLLHLPRTPGSREAEITSKRVAAWGERRAAPRTAATPPCPAPGLHRRRWSSALAAQQPRSVRGRSSRDPSLLPDLLSARAAAKRGKPAQAQRTARGGSGQRGRRPGPHRAMHKPAQHLPLHSISVTNKTHTKARRTRGSKQRSNSVCSS